MAEPVGSDLFNPDRIKDALTRKVGPLPLWGWGAIALGVLLVWRYRQGNATESSYPYETDPSYYDYGADTSGVGGGSSGGGGTLEDMPGIVDDTGKGGKGKGHGCPKGYKWSKKQKRCVKIKGQGNDGGGKKGGGHGCPPGKTWDEKKKRCVNKDGKAKPPPNQKGKIRPGFTPASFGSDNANLPPGLSGISGNPNPPVSGTRGVSGTGQKEALTKVKPSSVKVIHRPPGKSNVQLESNGKNSKTGRPLAGVPIRG